MIALPRPPPASRTEGEKGNEDMVIGSQPQAAQKQPDGSDKEFDEDSPEDSDRILLSNEIVLRGHTKVQGWKANNSPSSSRSRHHFKQLPLKEDKMRLCWADLPGDLLANITEKASTTNTQYVHLRAVCKAWRSALTPHPHHLPPQLPWLMLPRFFNDIHRRLDISDHISFYDIARSKTYRFQLPYMRGKYCRGSSHGWFVLQHEDERQVSLFNPVTSRYIDLPSLDAPSTLGGRIRIQKSCLSCTPSKPGCVVVALLSPPRNGELCFCQIGDSHWSELKKRDVGSWLVDFTIYNNLVYTVNSKKFISVCDLKDRSVWTFPAKINFYILRNDQINLVEGDGNSSGPLVVRTFVYNYSGITRVHAYKWCDFQQDWRRVRNIGKRVLFLNKMCSVNVQCDEKQESGVYYNVKQHSGNIESFRVGIRRANMENGKVVPDMPSPMDVFPSICGYSPLWVTPSLI
ncbi:uncharacterized protein LOC144544484 isoform X2 [Carex rostrata]